jgi:hypothetical protein
VIAREADAAVKKALGRQAAVALTGPRQVGKTTLALDIAESIPSIYLDLEDSSDRLKIADPAPFFDRYEDKLVVLDEIHRVPELFAMLRGRIDRGRRHGHSTSRFLILGSASMELLKQSSESLAGRISYVEMGPLNVRETAATNPDFSELWVRGGFPGSYLGISDSDSFLWRHDFIRTYLERDVPMLGHIKITPRIPASALERLWMMLAHEQGGLVNASRLATSLMVSAQTVTRYVDLLEDLLLVRRLQPFQGKSGKRLVKSPKVYVRDSGLVHALLGIHDFNALVGHPVVGGSWEGFAIENLIAAAPARSVPGFYRTIVGAEIDLLLEIPGHGLWAMEIKRSLSATPAKGFYIACEDLKPDRRFLVNAGEGRYPIRDGVEGIGLLEMAGLLAGL